jgi:hypothetical protein
MMSLMTCENEQLVFGLFSDEVISKFATRIYRMSPLAARKLR